MGDAAHQITLTFPDGAKRQIESGTSGLDVAKSISPSLAKRTVAMTLDGVLSDLSDPITYDARIKFVARTDPEALELIRHDAAHVMAEAVQSLWPGTQVTIGPVIENGFYYDFAKQQPFEPDDLAKIEKKMGEIIARNAPFTKEFWDRDKARKFFRDKGEYFKVELVDAIPEGEELKIYRQGEWLDLCRGPHMTSTGQVGRAIKLMKFAGSYWRGDATKPQLQRVYGTAWATEEELKAYLHQLEEAEKRDHRKLGREMDLFHFQEEAPGSVFWHPNGWTLFQTLIAYMRRRLGESRLHRGQLSRHDGEALLGALRPLGELPRDDVRHRAPRRAHLLLQADELPGPHPDLQARAQELPRPADQDRRVRQGAPLRAVGRHARAPPRAPLHAGRRPHLHHRGPARGAVPRGERPLALDLRGLRLQGYRREAVDAAREARRHRRAVGPRGSGDEQGPGRDRAARGRPHQDVDQSGRGRLLRAQVRVRAEGRDRPRLAVRHDAGRFQPAGAFGGLLHRRALGEEDAGHDPPRDLRLARALHGRA